jgi:hypothetical protein
LIPWPLLLLPGALARDDGLCRAWRAAVETGVVVEGDLDEISGLAASHVQPGVLWVHNDAGGGSRVFALSNTGARLGAWSVLGATNTDWEDLAIGPCGGGGACSCLYIGDFGDNDLERATYVIWRVPEPEAGGVSSAQTAAAEALHFQYPDGPHDAETLLVAPDTGEVLVLTKAQGRRTGVYAFPEAPPRPSTAADPTTLISVTTLFLENAAGDSESVTGGVVSPRGSRIFLRSDTDVYLFAGSAGGTLSSVLATSVVRLPAPPAGGNAEALGISADGLTLHLVGEGEHAPLYEVSCASFESDGLSGEDPLVECASDDDTGSEVQPTCGCQGKGEAALLLPLPWGFGLLRRARRRAAGRSTPA